MALTLLVIVVILILIGTQGGLGFNRESLTTPLGIVALLLVIAAIFISINLVVASFPTHYGSL